MFLPAKATLRKSFATMDLTSREFITFPQDRAIRLLHSSVYYPQANGQIERFNRTFKNIIQVSLLEGRPLRQAVMDYLATPRATTGVAPAVVLHGRMPRTRLDVVGFSAPAFAKEPAKELARLRRRVRRQQQSSKLSSKWKQSHCKECFKQYWNR